MTNRLHVATEFGSQLGWRYRSEGDLSGEELRELLIERLAATEGPLVVDFDGCTCPVGSFLEEVFGGLVRARGLEEAERIQIASEQWPLTARLVRWVIGLAAKEVRG